MDTPQVQPAPCPKCGGVRFLNDAYEFGLRYAGDFSALYCTGCGYVEFYATPYKLDQLAKQRAKAAHEKDARHDSR